MKPLLITILTIALTPLAYSGSTNTVSHTHQAPRMYSRTFPVATEVFVHNLRRSVEPKADENASATFLRFLKQKGFEMRLPSNAWIDEKAGSVYVRTEEADLAKIAEVVAKLNRAE